jgi:hypothetical protein
MEPITSPALASVDRACHKLRGRVKSDAPTAPSWGRGEAYEIVEEIKGKLLYRPAGLSHNNDNREISGKRKR